MSMDRLILPQFLDANHAIATPRNVGMRLPVNAPCSQIKSNALTFPRIPSTWTVACILCSLAWPQWQLICQLSTPPNHRRPRLEQKAQCSPSPAHTTYSPFWIASTVWCGEERAYTFGIRRDDSSLAVFWIPHAVWLQSFVFYFRAA